MAFSRIRTKILVGMLGIVLLFGLLTVLVVAGVTGHVLREEVEKRQIYMAQQTAQESVTFLVTENILALQLLLEKRLAEKDVVYAFIVDRDGHVVAHTFGKLFPVQLKDVRCMPGEPIHFCRLQTNEGPILDVAAPILEGKLGTMRIGISEKGIRRSVNQVLAALVLIIVVIGASVSWVGIIFSNIIAQPILELVKGVRILRTGDLTYRVPEQTKDEIGVLSRAFNQATEELSKITVSRDALVREVAERKRIGKALRASESKYRSLVETTGTGYLILDAQGRVLDANQEYVRLTGHSDLRDILGKSVLEWTSKEIKPQNAEALARCIKDRSIRNFATEYEDENGRIIPVEINATVEGEGESLHIISLCRDITERRKMEEAKRHLLRQEAVAETKSRFASMVSHELRSPLAVIRGTMEVLLEGLVGHVSEEQKELLETGKKTSDRLGRLINNVLDFQKIEAGKMEFDFTKSDLNEVVREVHNSMGILAKKKGLDLALELKEDLPRIQFDRDRIIQVIMNLVSNAIKYTEKGSITLHTRLEKDGLLAGVRDTGVGISHKDKERIFQAFEQVDSVRDKEKGGTGLGLAISKEIILAHRGRIWVESEAGKGSTFNFVLPL